MATKRRAFCILLSFVLFSSCGRDNKPVHEPPISPSPNPQAVSPSESNPPPSSSVAATIPNLGLPFTLAQLERYKAVKDKIWKSQLGLLFRTYVTASGDRTVITTMARMLADRIFFVQGEELIRIAALQVLIEDLYEQGLFTEETAYRMTLLEGNIFHKEFVYTRAPTQDLMGGVPVFMAIAFLAGSRVFMSQFRGLLRNLGRGLVTLLKTGRFSGFSELKTLNIKKVLGPGFFDGYSLSRAIAAFVDSFGTISFAYLYVYRGNRDIGEELGEGRVIIYGLERLIEMDEL